MSAVCRKCGRPFDEEIRITAGGEKTICDECGASQESESGILSFDTNHIMEIVGGADAVRERNFQELPSVGMKKRPKDTPPDPPRPAAKGTAGRNPVEEKKPKPAPVRRPAVEPERACATPDEDDLAHDTPVYGVPKVWEYPVKEESASRDESAGDFDAEDRPSRRPAKARDLEDDVDEDLAGATQDDEDEEDAPRPRGRSVPDSEAEDVADTRDDEDDDEEEEERAPRPRGRSVPDSEVEDVADTVGDEDEDEEEERVPRPRGRSVPDSEAENIADTVGDADEEEERAPLPRGRSVPDSEAENIADTRGNEDEDEEEEERVLRRRGPSTANESGYEEEDRPARRAGTRPSEEESDPEDEESSSSEDDPRAGARRAGKKPGTEREVKKDSVRALANGVEREGKKDSVRAAKNRKDKTDRSRRSATTGRSRRATGEEETAGPAASRWRNPRFLIPFLVLVVLPIVAATLVFLERIKVFQWPWSDRPPEKIVKETDYKAQWKLLQEKYAQAASEFQDGLKCRPLIASDSPEDPYRKKAIEHMRNSILLYEEIAREGNRILEENRNFLREKYKKAGDSPEVADQKAYRETSDFYGELTRWERDLKDPQDVLKSLEKKPDDGEGDSGTGGTGEGGGG